ncbi:MAG: hypothetical protein ABWX92_03350, partial [Mycetocola sp.]
RLLVETLSEALGLALDRLPDDVGDIARAEPEEWHALYGVVLDQLRAVVTPRITDGFAQQRIKGLARAIKYLEAIDLTGRTLADRELADLESVLGMRPSSTLSGRAQLARAVRDATIDPHAALAVIYRRVQRDNLLLRGSSGVLAERHFDPLTRFANRNPEG